MAFHQCYLNTSIPPGIALCTAVFLAVMECGVQLFSNFSIRCPTPTSLSSMFLKHRYKLLILLIYSLLSISNKMIHITNLHPYTCTHGCTQTVSSWNIHCHMRGLSLPQYIHYIYYTIVVSVEHLNRLNHWSGRAKDVNNSYIIQITKSLWPAYLVCYKVSVLVSCLKWNVESLMLIVTRYKMLCQTDVEK